MIFLLYNTQDRPRTRNLNLALASSHCSCRLVYLLFIVVDVFRINFFLLMKYKHLWLWLWVSRRKAGKAGFGLYLFLSIHPFTLEKSSPTYTQVHSMDFNTGVWGEVSDRDASHPCLAFPPKDIVGNIELKQKLPNQKNSPQR